MSLASRAAAYESAMWGSLFRWLRGERPGPGSFGYVGITRPILLVFLVLSLVEVPLFDWLVRLIVPWAWVRWVVLALGVYGVIWMFGLLAMQTLSPHLVTPRGLRVRSAPRTDLEIEWGEIAAVHPRVRPLAENKTIMYDGEALIIAAGGQTNVDVVLHAPRTFDLPQGTGKPVKVVRLHADDNDGLVAAVRAHLTADQPS